MAHRIIYYPPSGACIDDANLADITHQVVSGDAGYWNAGSRHAAIILDEDSTRSPSALLSFAPDFGFYVEVRLAGVTFIPDAQLDRREVTTIWTGQSRYQLPRDFFISRAACKEVVTTFCLRAELDNGTRWIEKRHANWQFVLESPEEE